MSHPIYYSFIINEALLIEQLASASEKYILNLRSSFSSNKSESYSISEFEIELSNYHEWLSIKQWGQVFHFALSCKRQDLTPLVLPEPSL